MLKQASSFPHPCDVYFVFSVELCWWQGVEPNVIIPGSYGKLYNAIIESELNIGNRYPVSSVVCFSCGGG